MPSYFSVRRGELAGSLNSEFYHPDRLFSIRAIKDKWGDSRLPLGSALNFGEEISPFKPGVFYVGLANIQSNTGIFIETHEEEPGGTCRQFKKGDVLYGKLRPYLNKVYIASIDGQCSTDIYALRPKDGVELDPGFLSAFLLSRPFLLQSIHMMTGNTHPRIQREEFERILMPLPPQSVQRKLAEEVETAKEARRRKLDEADELLSGLDYSLLKRIGIAPKDARNSRFFAARLSDMQKRVDPDFHSAKFKLLRESIENSEYEVVSVKDIHLSIKTGFAAGREAQAFDGILGIPHIRPLNITPHGELRFTDTKYVPIESIAKEDIVLKGEILFNNTNSTQWVGKSTVFESDRVCCSSNHITRITVDPNVVEPWYLASLFNALRSTGYLGLLATNFVNQAGINSETLSELRLPFPKIEVQQEIVSDLHRRMSEASQLHEEAEREWKQAKAQFEMKILGEEGNS